MASISDLGGLGDREGPAVIHNWSPPSPILGVLSFLPWLAILLLMFVPANRRGQTWWIWLPLIALWILGAFSGSMLAFLPSESVDIFVEIGVTLAFGLSAVWLLGDKLGTRHRFLTLLTVLLVLGGFSLLTFVLRLDRMEEWYMPLQIGITLAVCVLSITLAFSLTGLCSRRRYRPVLLTLWLMVWLAVVWIVIALAIFLVMVAFGEEAPWSEMLVGVLLMAGLNFAILLPFLVLAFASPFFRERLKRLLKLSQEEEPPVIPAVPANSPVE